MEKLSRDEIREIQFLLEEKIREIEILIKSNERFMASHEDMESESYDIFVKTNSYSRECIKKYKNMYNKLDKER